MADKCMMMESRLGNIISHLQSPSQLILHLPISTWFSEINPYSNALRTLKGEKKAKQCIRMRINVSKFVNWGGELLV